ncbi:MAG: hypothetical protein ABUT20_41695 [Bacteroidota bacterium]
MKLPIYILFSLLCLGCNSYVNSDDFERELNENITINERILIPDLVKTMEAAYIMDTTVYPYYKIFQSIQLNIDSTMKLLLNASISDEKSKLEFNKALIFTTNQFTDESLFLKFQHTKILSLTKDSIKQNYSGKPLRAILRNHLEIFKIECLKQIVRSISSRCKFYLVGQDTLISSQIDSFKYSIDVLQSRDFITTFISIDSIFKNNKKLAYLPTMQSMKYNAVLNFDTLKSGNYRIVGSVNGVNSMKYLFENKFTLEFKK